MNNSYRTHRDLDVYQKALDMVDLVYLITKNFPKDEIYGLANQIRRSAVSIPSNIAEGAGRNSIREYIRYITIARGSASELETQLVISFRQGYISDDKQKELLGSLENIGKMLTKFQKSLEASITNND